MRVAVPRIYLVGIAILFSALHVAIALYSIRKPGDHTLVLIAIALYILATGASLLRPSRTSMPAPIAIGIGIAVVLIVALASVHLDSERLLRSEGWYVAACGTVLTIAAIRHRYILAWLGIFVLFFHEMFLGGLSAVINTGVIGTVAWVGAAYAIGRGMARTRADIRIFAEAEREAANWYAAQEAHVTERQARVEHTSQMALAMLRVIVETGGHLSSVQAQECLYLEGAIRDEIRGRQLLNDAVRRDVMQARRSGITVSLLDEGGIDDLDDAQRDRVLDRVADAIRAAKADRLVIRTAPETSDVAVTVVGLRHPLSMPDESPEDDEVAVWLEVPRNL
jgi:hypothetical protein